jgi:sugar phosphate permease
MILGSNYAFSFSAPTLLKAATHWDSSHVGFFMSGSALIGAVAMLLNGLHSDRRQERHLHVAAPLALMAVALTSIGLFDSPSVILPAYVLYYMGTYAVQSAFWPFPATHCAVLRRPRGLPQSAPSACSAAFSARTYGAWREIIAAVSAPDS